MRQLGGSKYSMTDGGDGQLKTTDGFEVTVQRTGVTVAKRNDGSFSYLYQDGYRFEIEWNRDPMGFGYAIAPEEALAKAADMVAAARSVGREQFMSRLEEAFSSVAEMEEPSS